MVGRGRALVLGLLLTAATAGTAETVLFVNSAPMLAEVTIDGTAYGATPLLVRGLAPGEHEIELIKPGYVPATELIELADDEVRAVTLRPQPSRFVAEFSADRTVVGDRVYARQEATLLVPTGTYQLAEADGALLLSPRYPNEGALSAARLVTVATGIAALAATVEDLIVGDAQSYFTSRLPSPATVAAWTITAAAGGFWIALTAEKRAYEEDTFVRPYDGALTPAQAERFYLAGEAALESGNLSRALTNYSRVYAEGGDSEHLPSSLYKSARVYSVSGDNAIAAGLLEMLVRDYPAPELYDRALKSLADAYVALGSYDEAVERLRMMVFLDPLYERADVDADIAEIKRLTEEGQE